MSEAESIRTTTGTPPATAVVFDLGGVFIDWDPRHLYRKIFANERDMERFLEQVCTPTWHAQLDRGVPFSIASQALLTANPGLAGPIHAYHDRFPEMWGPVSHQMVALLHRLNDAGHPTYAATNWPGEYWDAAMATFAFLATFRGILVSGGIGVAKPSRYFFDILSTTFPITPSQTVFVDDRAENVQAAADAGYRSHRYVGMNALESYLQDNGLGVDAPI
ncbi:HAD family phosphatase [Ferrimicrobium sp.]|uniref:HAD family hydrolase n=1 Tax=Ferrimicrobium sp. TaxID=2926050 RepID=UPI00262F7C90|nr:HAD family phosphatase [Ferrimicrobium sp.]